MSWSICVGPFLGELTDELSKNGDRHIREFVSTGPKSYSFKDNFGSVSCRFKGIKKTLFNLQYVNLESMLECIEEGVVRVIDEKTNDSRIISQHPVHGAKNMVFKLDKHGRIQTKHQNKVFRMVYDKRWITEGYVTFPWGFS